MQEITSSRWLLACAAMAALILAWAGTLALRSDALAMRQGVEALEATDHALWTMTALSESSPDAHRWLPTVVLDPRPGDPLRWGATQPTEGGALIYTSFPPLGFLLPLGLLKLFGADLGLASLAYLNAAFGLVAALAVGLLCASVMTASASRPLHPVRRRA